MVILVINIQPTLGIISPYGNIDQPLSNDTATVAAWDTNVCLALTAVGVLSSVGISVGPFLLLEYPLLQPVVTYAANYVTLGLTQAGVYLFTAIMSVEYVTSTQERTNDFQHMATQAGEKSQTLEQDLQDKLNALSKAQTQFAEVNEQWLQNKAVCQVQVGYLLKQVENVTQLQNTLNDISAQPNISDRAAYNAGYAMCKTSQSNCPQVDGLIRQNLNLVAENARLIQAIKAQQQTKIQDDENITASGNLLRNLTAVKEGFEKVNKQVVEENRMLRQGAIAMGNDNLLHTKCIVCLFVVCIVILAWTHMVEYYALYKAHIFLQAVFTAFKLSIKDSYKDLPVKTKLFIPLVILGNLTKQKHKFMWDYLSSYACKFFGFSQEKEVTNRADRNKKKMTNWMFSMNLKNIEQESFLKLFCCWVLPTWKWDSSKCLETLENTLMTKECVHSFQDAVNFCKNPNEVQLRLPNLPDGMVIRRRFDTDHNFAFDDMLFCLPEHDPAEEELRDAEAAVAAWMH